MFPLGNIAAGSQQRQSGTTAIGLVEDLSQHALGLTERLMTTCRGRGINNDQQQLGRPTAARLAYQIVAALWTTTQQRRQPGNRTIDA